MPHKERLCIDTCDDTEHWLPMDAEVVEFMGSYRGSLERAPAGILAFVTMGDRTLTASVELETRDQP